MNNNQNKALLTGVIAGLAASSCCIPPVIAFVAGMSGASTSLSWMEPFSPYLIVLTIIALTYAWYANLKSKKADDCGCEIKKPKFYQTKGFLVAMTLFATLSITFPYYSFVFYSPNTTEITDSNSLTSIEIKIEGMTCKGCENHVSSSANSIEGVIESKASYENGLATIKFDSTKTKAIHIQKTIEKATGYEVLNIKNK